MLAWIGLLFIWLTAMVDFLVPSLATMADSFSLKQSVAGVTLLALGNGSSDIFSMVAATVSGPKGMELALGEVRSLRLFYRLLATTVYGRLILTYAR
jgi:sodium/potassium/calcium exchanger 6